MKYHIQTKRIDTHRKGNCYPTAIACVLDMSPEDIVSFENLYLESQENKHYINISKVMRAKYLDNKDIEDITLEQRQKDNYSRELSLALNAWDIAFRTFLAMWGYRDFYIHNEEDHKKFIDNNPDKYYIATGTSARRVSHVVIMQNGKMIHDPHPSGSGLLQPDGDNNKIYYEYYEKVI